MTNPLRPFAIEEAMIRGAVEVESTGRGLVSHRLPQWARRQIPDVFMVQTSAEGAGVRLALRTVADVVELDVQGRRIAADASAPMPPSVYELTEGGAVVASAAVPIGSRYVFSFERPTGEIAPGPDGTARFTGLAQGRECDLELWLPYYDAVELLALRADAPVAPVPGAGALRWVHHGSSISHGYRADTTTGTWPVVAALRAGAELTNLAFSGNAMLDPFTARTIRDTPADLISLKIGINLVNGDVMRLRAFRPAVDGFLDTIREGHPDTPIVLVSPIWCAPVESSAGPTVQDPERDEEWSVAGGTEADVKAGKLSLRVVRAELESVVDRRRADGDHRLQYLDGLSLYGAGDAASMPLPDNLHPGPDVQRLIGERFARVLAVFTTG
ncbi:GDSL-type esterase/lipase family protein [Glycomyces harbinensis]|uniref:GDSL-like Lipase/Acylhydrolase family protein n=1 Tax=Glycomyces harbinensis TaxID=58114 RepID=A0A1G6QNZ4_9ACTN|nr:GDSL-type esterase/lipase family protein [Glycomyces harbinensis]SDC94112.1 GDSL-like Lipase/Acylhydrolase family protein [Glycomyces harbinensis]